MSRPPIKAFETVKRYCEKNKTCKGCPLHYVPELQQCFLKIPKNWKIRKEGEEE